jgi:hypothetical protein
MRGDTQRNARHTKEHDIRKVSAEDIIRQGERKQPVPSSRSNGALNRGRHLRKTIRGAKRPFVGAADEMYMYIVPE